MNSRFSGVGRLYPPGTLARLAGSHVGVIGVGGVGSWAAEALARSGVGRISLVDLDDVCITNINRQAHAIEGTVALPKVEAMAARIRLINPGCRIDCHPLFYTAASEERILETGFDAVVDAFDSVSNKARLAAACLHRNIPLIVSGGAGGRVNPTAIRIGPLEESSHDRLLSSLRKKLKQELPPEVWKVAALIPTVYSKERVRPATDGSCEGEQGRVPGLKCESGYGSAVFVTGAFGFAAAGWVINHLAGDEARL